MNKSLQQDEDVIRRDDQDKEDVTTKDQDDLSDKTSDEVKCLYRPQLSAGNAAMCVSLPVRAGPAAGGGGGWDQ